MTVENIYYKFMFNCYSNIVNTNEDSNKEVSTNISHNFSNNSYIKSLNRKHINKFPEIKDNNKIHDQFFQKAVEDFINNVQEAVKNNAFGRFVYTILHFTQRTILIFCLFAAAIFNIVFFLFKTFTEMVTENEKIKEITDKIKKYNGHLAVDNNQPNF